jgi:hypothetical protein
VRPSWRPHVACNVEVVAENVNSKAFARAFVMYELVQVRDGHSQLLAVMMMPFICSFRNKNEDGCPVLKHFLLVEVL